MAHKRHNWLPMAALFSLIITGTAGLPVAAGQDTSTVNDGTLDPPPEGGLDSSASSIVLTAVGTRKHALGYTTSLGSSEVGKVYVPTRYGGVLTLKGNARLYYTNGADLTVDLATQIYNGNLEGSRVAQGNWCTYTVPAGRWGWFYFVVPGGTSGIANTFVEAGQSAHRPWNGWWWPLPNNNNPNLYDAGGPFDKFDRVYDGTTSSIDPSSPRTTFFQQKMDTDPGWTTEGGWAWGQPTGGQGTHGGRDPTAGYTGSNVYGYNLTGGYENNMTPKYLTTTAINCSEKSGVHLRFRRWLGIEESKYDHASIQVSNNLTTWVSVWSFSGGTLTETAWSLQEYDISAVADNQSAVYIRWVMGPTDVGWTYGGWNIDDVELTASAPINAFYQQKLDTNPGWSTTGGWAFGTPTGGGGDHGGADPRAGYTGSNVYGYNLNGGYTNNMTPQYLTTTAINCSGQTGIHLRFRRWLCIEESKYDHASVQVSSNLSNWTTVWDFSGPTLVETSWSLQEYDISAVADGKPAVYIRWVIGPTDVGWTWGGWNIDDIELTSGNAPLPQPDPKTFARSWEATNHAYGDYWYGHCWGWSIAAILIPQPQSTTKKGVFFSRDDMEGLYTELCDTQPYADSSLSLSYIPATAPTSTLGQNIDLYCDDLYRILRISIREDKVPVQSDMRARATPPAKSNEVWNQSIYKYSTMIREVPGSNNERLVELDMDVWSNYGPWGPPTDYTNDRYEEFIYRLEFDTQGQVITNSSKQNWTYASHYPPRDLYRLTGSPYKAKNPYVTKSRVDALYQP